MKELIKVIIKNSKRQEKLESTKEKLLSLLAFCIVFGFLATTMITVSVIVTQKLRDDIKQPYMFITMLLLTNFVILYAKSIFESLNVLYFSKDLKQLLRMPIKSKYIVNAKLINMIISEYQMEFIMLAIPMIVYGIMMKVGWLFYLFTALTLMILPVIPIATTSVIVAILMRIFNKMKNKTKIMYLTILLSAVLIDFLFTGFQPVDLNRKVLEESVLIENGLSDKIVEQFIVLKPIMNTVLNYNNSEGIKNLSIYIGESLVIYIICLAFISSIYLKGAIGTTINSKKNKKSNAKLTIRDFEQKSKVKAYTKKEFRVMSRSPIFCLQCIIVPIIYPLMIFGIFCVAVVFSKNIGLNIIRMFIRIIGTSYGQATFLCVAQVFFMMNFGSIIGISKDGKTAILTKTLPMKLEKQFELKTLIGKRINYLSTAIIIFCHYCIVSSIKATIVLTAILYLMNSIGEKVKLIIDSRKPQMNWDSEYTMMKQNTNVMNVLFYTLAMLIAMFLMSLLIKSYTYYLAIMLVLFLIGYGIVENYIRNNKEKIFGKIY